MKFFYNVKFKNKTLRNGRSSSIPASTEVRRTDTKIIYHPLSCIPCAQISVTDSFSNP